MSSSDQAAAGWAEFERDEIEQTIHSRFEKQASRNAKRVAVQTSDCQLSYQELNRRANQLAHGILATRGQREEPVALLLEQGAPLIWAVLGALKAAKTYVPLDPASPVESIRKMLRHSEAPLILTDCGNRALAAELGGSCQLMCADDFHAGFPDGPPNVTVAPGVPAYIYYTSGSTGEPKGVIDNHRNVLHNIMRYTNGLRIGFEDRLSLLQQASFSGAVSSMFSALLNGASLFPFDPRKESAAALAAWATASRLTMWHSVPSLFRQLCAGGDEFPSIRMVRLEGDQVSPADVELFRQHFKHGCTLVNGLGATETGITRRFFIGPGTELRGGLVPVGYPVEDMEVVVIDKDGNSLSCGKTGEIEVRSRYLAIGYWKQPQLTRRAFRQCSDDPTMRSYRSGDLGRMQPDGCLEHLGRMDSRVKVRGNWVDLADVESALRSLPGIAQAVVAAGESRHGETRLVGYVVAESPPGPPANLLRRRLSGRLAPHEIPAVFVTMDSLPLNENGKVDRRALPAPGNSRPELDTAFLPPQTEGEKQMAALWQRVLGLDAVGIDDDFFELGGDSLDLARLLSQVNVGIEQFLRAPTIRRLVAVQTAGFLQDRKAPADDVLVTLRQGRDRPPVFCLPGHDGELIGYAALTRYLEAGQPVHSFLPPALPDSMSYDLCGLAQHNVRALRTVQPAGPYLLCGLCFGGYLAYEMACQLDREGQPVALLVLVGCFRDGWVRELGMAQRLLVELAHLWRRSMYHLDQVLGPDRKPFRAYTRQRLDEVRAHWIEMCRQTAFDRCIGSTARLPEHLRLGRYANRAAARRWVPQPYGGRALLIGGSEPRAGFYPAPLMGWQNLLIGEVETLEVADRLNGLLAEPAVGAVAEHLTAAIASALSGQ